MQLNDYNHTSNNMNLTNSLTRSLTRPLIRDFIFKLKKEEEDCVFLVDSEGNRLTDGSGNHLVITCHYWNDAEVWVDAETWID